MREMVDYIKKLKDLIFHPTTFFNNVEKETEIMPILLFYAVITIILGLVGTLIALPITIKAGTVIPEFTGLGIGMIIFLELFVGMIMIAAFAFIGPFIASAIAHVGVWMVKGKQGFFNTFKPVTYAMVIAAVYQFVSTIISTIMELINPTYTAITLGIAEVPSLGSIITPTFIVAIIIGIISFIHVLFVEIIGVAKFQNISRGRAFMAVFVIPLLLVIAVIIIFALIIGLFVGLFALVV